MNNIQSSFLPSVRIRYLKAVGKDPTQYSFGQNRLRFLLFPTYPFFLGYTILGCFQIVQWHEIGVIGGPLIILGDILRSNIGEPITWVSWSMAFASTWRSCLGCSTYILLIDTDEKAAIPYMYTSSKKGQTRGHRSMTYFQWTLIKHYLSELLSRN